MASQSLSEPPNTLLFFLSFVFIFIILPPSAESLSFRIPRFDPNTTNVVYEGDALPSNGEIILNRGDYVARVARATYGEHLRVSDPANGNLTDFVTNFSFIIDTQNKSVGNYGDGIVFFFSPVDSKIPPNSVGGFLGLFNTTTLLSPSKNNILGVEFDSYSDEEWDPPGEHVGFIINSLSSAEYVSWNASLHSLDVANAQISYKGSTKKLNLLLTYKNSPSRYNVSLNVDLRKILPEWVKIGFSTATATVTEIPRILSWEFSSTLEGNEPNHATTARNKQQNMKLILGLSIPLGIAVVVVILLVWVILKRSKTKEGEDQEDQGEDQEDQGIALTSIDGTFDRALGIISGRIRR